MTITNGENAAMEFWSHSPLRRLWNPCPIERELWIERGPDMERGFDALARGY
jgi:hypothetical protein